MQENPGLQQLIQEGLQRRGQPQLGQVSQGAPSAQNASPTAPQGAPQGMTPQAQGQPSAPQPTETEMIIKGLLDVVKMDKKAQIQGQQLGGGYGTSK